MGCGGVWGVGGGCVVSVGDGGGGSVRGVCVTSSWLRVREGVR